MRILIFSTQFVQDIFNIRGIKRDIVKKMCICIHVK